MAHEGSSVHVSSPPDELVPSTKDTGDNCQQDLWYTEGNDIIEAGGPSSVEVQPDLSGSPRSISASSQLDDFNSSISPSNPLAEAEGGDLDIMGIANSWNDDEAFCNESAIPARGMELSCLSLGQTASSGPWPSPTPLFPTALDLFEDDRESVCELLGDVADSNSIPGVCGLRNLGNTCFMNAGLQCLINTPPLLNYFHSNSIDEQYPGCNSVHLTAQFATFLLKMWSGRFSTLRPAEFKHTLSLYHPQFKDYRQHDCQEFLALLLDSLHEHLSQTALKEGNPNRPRDIVTVPGHDADLPADCCLLTEEPMELYESSRSSQLSSPRSSSDSVETSSSCTTSCSSTRVKAAALSLRSLPIPEEVKQPLFPLSIHPPSQDGTVTDVLFKGSALSPQKGSLIMERNMLNQCSDPVQNIVLEKNLLSEISSMMKESKTANVNISAGSAETSPNNEIYFDSGKFPATDQAKPRAAVASTLVRNTDSAQILLQAQQHIIQKNKIKNTNMLKETAKRLSEDQNLSSPSSFPLSSAEVTPSGDQSLPSPNNENISSISKKARLENDGGQEAPTVGPTNDNRGTSPWDSLGALNKAVREEESCRSDNGVSVTNSMASESVVTHTFQGQFRSTVVCCSCKHVSVTYEPFMYLSVPLPRALERQIEVVYIPASGTAGSSRHRLLLQQYDEVSKLRQMLAKCLGLEDERSGRLVLTEVANRVIVRFLEDQLLLRNLTDGQHRSVYAFAVPPPCPSLTPSALSSSDNSCSTLASVSASTTQPSDSAESKLPSPVIEHSWKSCAICLEEMADTELRKHTSCTCLLCQSCIEASCRHHRSSFGSRLGEYLQCPVCSMDVKPEEEFAPLDKLHYYQPVIRLLNLPVLFRLASNSRSASPKSSRLVGHPRLLQLPNLVSPRSLYDTVKNIYPKVNAFDLCFVDQQGVRCPRCVYPNRCNGCKISAEADQISLQPGDCLAVQVYTLENEDFAFAVTKWEKVFDLQTVAEQDDSVNSSSSSASRFQKEPLTLDDCLTAFSESETLDEGNPWFCPKCQKSQCASKTLSICQAPPYLIVYLKRFVFHDNSSSKLDNRVEFPLTGLSLQPYIDRGDVNNGDDNEDYTYDLYGVVCHFGSASSGHYTAYTRHVNSKDWHYYNDETVLSRAPQDEDFSHGYVLFYQRRNRQSCQDEVVVPCVMDK